MLYVYMTRRSFLTSAAGAALIVALPGCEPQSGLGENDKRTLLRMARLLYPHDALADDIYVEVLQPLQVQAAGDATLSADLRAGFETLDGAAGADWRTAPAETQIETLRRIEDGAFFGTVQEAVRTSSSWKFWVAASMSPACRIMMKPPSSGLTSQEGWPCGHSGSRETS